MGQRQKNLLDTHNGPDVWDPSADEMKVLDLLCEVGDGRAFGVSAGGA